MRITLIKFYHDEKKHLANLNGCHFNSMVCLRWGYDTARTVAETRLGIDMDAVGNTLQDDGVKSFEDAYQKLQQQTG